MVLEVNRRGKEFYNTVRVVVERTYKHTFHSEYRNQSNDSKNQIICKLQEALRDKWSMRPVRIGIEKTYNNKKNHWKSNIPKHDYVEYVCINTTKRHFFNNFNSVILFICHINTFFLMQSFYISRKIMKIPKDEWGDMLNVPVGVSKKVCKEMVKEIEIIAL